MRRYGSRGKKPDMEMHFKMDEDGWELIYSSNRFSNNAYREAVNWKYGYLHKHPNEILEIIRHSVIRTSNGKIKTVSDGASVWRKK